METTIKCNNCDREMGLAEFLAYPEAYFMKLVAPTIATFVVAAIAQKLSSPMRTPTGTETKGFIDNNMAGLANSFSIACPNCGKINWYPASGPKPKDMQEKNNQTVV